MATREHINEYFNGQAFMVLSALAMVLAAAVAWMMGVQPPSGTGTGVFFSLADAPIGHGPLSAVINVLCLLATGGILLAVNKVFTFARSMTHLFASAFFLLQLANPSGLVAFNAGTLMALVTALSMLPLFASYQDKHSQHAIFLIFALVAAGSMFHYGFLVLLPAFVMGFFYMGVFNLKGVLAMLFGLVTPFWIVLGLGIASPADFTMPRLWGVWQLAGQGPLDTMAVVAAVIAAVGLVLAGMNIYSIMKYRRQTRVYNAFIIIVLLLSVCALAVDVGDISTFLPLLNLTVAVQVSLITHRHRYVFLLLFIAACLCACAASLI